MDYWLYTEVTSVMADALELSTLDRMVFALTYSVKSPVILEKVWLQIMHYLSCSASKSPEIFQSGIDIPKGSLTFF